MTTITFSLNSVRNSFGGLSEINKELEKAKGKKIQEIEIKDYPEHLSVLITIKYA